VDFENLAGFKKAVLMLFKNFRDGKNIVSASGVEQYSRKVLCGDIANILNEISK
jgi:hypothetical protein